MEKSRPLSEKLYVIRNIEGEQNTEHIKVLRDLEEKFSQYSWFIGIALMGSSIRGYNERSSDIDCKIIYDRKEVSNIEVAKIVELHSQEVEKAHNLKAGTISIPYSVAFDIDKIRKVMQENGGRGYTDAILDLRDLSSVIIGENIEKYRAKIKEILSKLSVGKRQEIIKDIVDYCIQEEKLSEQKMIQRMKMNSDEMEQLWIDRKQLWERRVNALWS